MKSAVETLSPTRAKLTVEVPFEELKPSLDAAYKSIAKQINIPGFRKGKVPPPVIDRQVGRGAVLDEAINDALPKLYVQALQENDLQPLAQPEIDITKFEDNETLEFTAEVDVRPRSSCPTYDGLGVRSTTSTVTDEDVEEQVQDLRERFATLNDVERAAAGRRLRRHRPRGHARTARPSRAARSTAYSYKVGKGGMLDGLDEALTGLCAGDEATFTSQLRRWRPARRGRRGRGQGQLPSRSRSSPSSTTTSPRPPRSSTRSRSSRRRAHAPRARQAPRAGRRRPRRGAREAARPGRRSRCPRPSWPTELDARRQSRSSSSSRYAGMTMEDYLDNEEQTVDEFEADLEKRVRDAMAAQFLLDEVAKAEEIGVDAGRALRST